MALLTESERELEARCLHCGPRRLGEFRVFCKTPPVRFYDFCQTCEGALGVKELYRLHPGEGDAKVRAHVDEHGDAELKKAEKKAERELSAIQRDLAERELAHRHIIPFAKRFMPTYHTGWVHHDIAARLERFVAAIERGESPRLILALPPRAGKSILGSDFLPSWVLGKHPDWEIIAASHSVDLSLKFSRNIRDRVLSPQFHGVFEDCVIRSDNSGAGEWRTTAGGGYRAAGVGTGILGMGAHCLPEGVQVATEDGDVDIAHLYLANSLPKVLTPLGPRKIMAVSRRTAPALYDVHFASGAILRATAEHPVYIRTTGGYMTVEQLYGATSGPDPSDLCAVRRRVLAPEACSQQVAAARYDERVLHTGLRGAAPFHSHREKVCDVRGPRETVRALPECDVLRPTVPADAACAVTENLPGVRRGISAEKFADGILRSGVRVPCARREDAGVWEFAAHASAIVRVHVQDATPVDLGTRQSLLCGMCETHAAARTPHECEARGQHSGELDNAVRGPSYGASQVIDDAISVVTRSSSVTDFVYDIQVEDAGCFFADGVLVGNCLIVDDPFPDAEAAYSENNREKVIDWFNTTAMTRLSPGGGALIIAQRWHDDDLTGHVLAQRKELLDDGVPEDEIDNWQIVNYPAIAEGDEFLMPDGAIVVDPVVTAGGRLLRKKGEALHPARYDIHRLNRIKHRMPPAQWNALYQQNPVPDDGDFFTKDMFRYQPALDGTRDEFVFLSAWDVAIGESRRNDWSVGIVVAADVHNNMHVVDMVRGRFGTFELVTAACDLIQKWDCLQFGMEHGQIKMTLWPLLLEEMRRRKIMCGINDDLKPVTDKEVRAQPLRALMQTGRVTFPLPQYNPWVDDAVHEMLRFPTGAHDDIVDALSWAARLFQRAPKPQRPEFYAQKVEKSWRDSLEEFGVTSHGGTTYMAN